MDIRYSYESVPTVREFALSDARIRGLLGPFRCLSGDTEYLTPEGWKRLDAYTDGDLCAQWDQKTGKISFVRPLAYIVDKAEEFIQFRNQYSLCMRLSPEHRVPHYNWAGDFWVKTAAEIEARPSRRTIPTTFAGHDNDSLGMSDDLIRFAVMMHADGHYVAKGRQATVVVRKERKKTRIRDLLTRLGVAYKEKTYPQRPTETVFSFIPPYRGKRYDGFWWSASKRELAIVLDEMPYWDGLFDNDVSIFCSTHKVDADFIQYAAHANGLRASMSAVAPKTENMRPQYRLSVRMGDNAKNRACIREETDIQRVPSADGKMYCLSVPSTFFVARCENTVFITGNSGKSSGCVVEIVRRAQAQKKGPDGKRRTRWIIVRNCFDDQTEILTEGRGWQLFKDLEPSDRVATLQRGTDLVYERPSYYYSAQHRGEMVGCKSDGLDFLVTPDHRLWTSSRNNGEWSPYKHETALKAFGRELRRFKRDAEWSSGRSAYSVDFCEFLGFWFAEGYAGAYRYPDRREPHYRFVVVQKKREYVQGLLERAGFSWGENVSKENGCTYFRIHITPEIKPLVQELADLGGATQKRLPVWLRDLPKEHANAFLAGYFRGDGNRAIGRHRTLRAGTSSKFLADDLQELALRAGLVANVSRRKVRLSPKAKELGFKANTEYSYTVTFLTPSRHEPRARGWYKTQYDGMVYCVEVSSHVVYVRRNGKAHWSGQTFSQLEDSTIKTFLMWLPPQYFGKYNQTTHNYTVTGFPDTEMEVWFRALDRPDHVRNLLSVECTGAWVNEAREIPWAIINALEGRIEQYPNKAMGGCTWAGIIMDTNPPDTDSEWYKFFEDTKHPEWYAQIFRQPSGLSDEAENLPNLPNPNYYRILAQGKSPEWVNVYIHGKYGFVQDGKAVYPEYSDKLHLQAVDPIEGRPIIRSWDFGLTPCCVFSQLLPDGRWLVFDEMVSSDMSVDAFGDEVVEHCARAFRSKGIEFEDYGDPAGEIRSQTDKKTCFEILKAKGLDVEGSEQEPLKRIESVRKPLRSIVNGEPQFILHPRCKVLRRGFLGGYHYRRFQVPGPARYTAKPDKNAYSHPHDALQYAAVKLFGGSLVNEVQDDFPQATFTVSDIGRSRVTGY